MTFEHFYFKINKPYKVLSQFTDSLNRKTLSSLYKFPTNVYPVGRLDYDSEGLLLLTTDKSLTDRLLNPANKHEREYYVQVEGIPNELDLIKLENGLIIEGKKTLPAKVKFLDKDFFVPDRIPPIRFRKNIPTSWLSITLNEGRNRQVRKMTAKIGFPTLRLIRFRIENITINNLNSGDVRKLIKSELDVLIKSL